MRDFGLTHDQQRLAAAITTAILHTCNGAVIVCGTRRRGRECLDERTLGLPRMTYE